MNDKELALRLGSKVSAVKNYKRVYKQIRGTKERRENTVDLSYKSYKSLGYTKTQMTDVKKELIRTAGNAFTYLSDFIADMDTSFRQTRTKDNDSWTEANNIIKQALLLEKSKRKKFLLKLLPENIKANLSEADYKLLSEFSP